MGLVEKKGMLALITRCENVIDGEIRLMEKWGANTQILPNRRAACMKAAEIIRTTCKPRAAQTMTDAVNCPEAEVRRVAGEPRVIPNEIDLAHRASMNIVQFDQNKFDEFVDDSRHNSTDSTTDARKIFEDCTAP